MLAIEAMGCGCVIGVITCDLIRSEECILPHGNDGKAAENAGNILTREWPGTVRSSSVGTLFAYKESGLLPAEAIVLAVKVRRPITSALCVTYVPRAWHAVHDRSAQIELWARIYVGRTSCPEDTGLSLEDLKQRTIARGVPFIKQNLDRGSCLELFCNKQWQESMIHGDSQR